MRQVLLYVHRWLGLTAGLIFAITALTGGILIYQEELNDLLTGPRVDVTPGLVDSATIESSVRLRNPGSRLVRVEWPTPETKVFRVRMTDGHGQQDLELDPGSGTVLQPRRLHILLAATRRLHASLLMGWFGRPIVTYATGVTIVSLLLGLCLWWPGVRRFVRVFGIRLGRGFYTLAFDLHQTFGLVAFPLLFVMTATGFLMGSSSAQRVFSVLVEGQASVSFWAALRSQAVSEQGATDIDLATAARIAGTETGRTPIRVEFPTTANGVIEVWTQGASEWPHNAATRLALDRYTGSLLGRQNLAYDQNMNSRLHFARIGGRVVRVLYSISCFVGSGLLFTGFVMWWIRSKSNAIQRGQNAPYR